MKHYVAPKLDVFEEQRIDVVLASGIGTYDVLEGDIISLEPDFWS